MQNAPPAREGTNPGVLSGGPQGCNRRGDRSYVTTEDPDAPFSSAAGRSVLHARCECPLTRARRLDRDGARVTEREGEGDGIVSRSPRIARTEYGYLR